VNLPGRNASGGNADIQIERIEPAFKESVEHAGVKKFAAHAAFSLAITRSFCIIHTAQRLFNSMAEKRMQQRLPPIISSISNPSCFSSLLTMGISMVGERWSYAVIDVQALFSRS
jgi:hypothetical protein